MSAPAKMPGLQKVMVYRSPIYHIISVQWGKSDATSVFTKNRYVQKTDIQITGTQVILQISLETAYYSYDGEIDLVLFQDL